MTKKARNDCYAWPPPVPKAYKPKKPKGKPPSTKAVQTALVDLVSSFVAVLEHKKPKIVDGSLIFMDNGTTLSIKANPHRTLNKASASPNEQCELTFILSTVVDRRHVVKVTKQPEVAMMMKMLKANR